MKQNFATASQLVTITEPEPASKEDEKPQKTETTNSNSILCRATSKRILTGSSSNRRKRRKLALRFAIIANHANYLRRSRKRIRIALRK